MRTPPMLSVAPLQPCVSETEHARRRIFTRGFIFAASLLAGLGAGCATIATPPPAPSEFATAVMAAQVQTDTAFNAIADLTRSSAVDFAAQQPQLTEAAFVVVPNAAARDAWASVLSALEQYARHLSALAAGGPVADVETSTNALVQKFNTVSTDLKTAGIGGGAQVTDGLAAAFAATARRIIIARAQKEAAAVAAETDPEFQHICAGIAAAIGSRSDVALRGTVRANWNSQVMAVQARFVSNSDASDRHAAAKDFADLLQMRDVQDQMLASLRASFLALADAHSALANHNAGGIDAALAFIAGELKHARDLQSRYATP